MKMVYTYEVTIAVDLFAEPVVVEHTILADTRHNRRCILRSHLDHSPRTKLLRAVLLRAHKATAEEIRRSAECVRRGHPQHLLETGVGAGTTLGRCA
jgi:hypothetical protein